MAYDSDKYVTRRFLPVTGAADGFSLAGTAANDDVLFRLRIPRAITIDEATIVMLTGGTAAGPVVAIQKSAAGTGTASNVGTYVVGTAADNAGAALTITSTNFAAGDHLLVTNLAGTVASTPKVNLLIGFVETYS